MYYLELINVNNYNEFNVVSYMCYIMHCNVSFYH